MIYLLILFVWLAPLLSVFCEPTTAHDVHRAAQIGLLAVAAMALLASVRRWREIQGPSRPVIVLLVFAIVIGGFAVLHAQVRFWAGIEAATMLGLAALVLSVTIGAPEPQLKRFLMGALIGTAPYYLMLCGILVGAFASGTTLYRAEFFSGYSNYRFFNHVQTITLPMLAIVAVSPMVSAWVRRCAWGSLVLGFSFLWYTAARGTSVGLIAGGIAAIILLRATAWRVLRPLLLAALLGGLVFAVVFIGLPTLLGVSIDGDASALMTNTRSADLRAYLWSLAWHDIAESPWLGIGPMHFAHRPNFEAAHPHNFPLQVAAEWGVPMLILVLILSYLGLRRMRVSIARESDAGLATMGTGLWITCIAVAVDSLFSGNFVMPMSQVWIAYLLGWAIVWTRQANRGGVSGTVSSISRRSALAVAAVLLVSQLWLVYAIHDQVLHLNDHLDGAHRIVINDHDSPRFWSHGWF